MDTFKCPLNGQKVRPAKCIHCQSYWGLWNQGVLCQRANRWLPYKYDWEREQVVLKR
ncbi:MAG: hypothetical protein GX165_01205 [Firmicutes bacterium]|nr:hypothetical protein [Bacillota bacterium]NLN16824.1 hypothetical protein [Bacillota bacterium]